MKIEIVATQGKFNFRSVLIQMSWKGLFDSREFLNNIRSYNAAFAFASLGAQMAPPPGFGPYCFRIHGQIYHRTGGLHPPDGETGQYGQLYILDGSDALSVRAERNPALSRQTLATDGKRIDHLKLRIDIFLSSK